MGESDRYGEYRIKKSWRDRLENNAITKLIGAHVVVFIVLVLLLIIASIGKSSVHEKTVSALSLPGTLADFIRQPWTLFTYSFAEYGQNFFRFLSNMVWLFFFAQILKLYTRDAAIIPVFIYGTLLGAMGYIAYAELAYKTLYGGLALFGAHNGVMALAFAATFLAPTYKILPQLRGGISLWIVTLIYLLINAGSVSAVGQPYAVGLLCAGLSGIAFSLCLKNEIDITDWMNDVWQKIKLIFQRPDSNPVKSKVFYKTGNRKPYNKEPIVTQKIIDEILDKINDKGINALTVREKEILRRHAEDGKA